ncbi:MAG TPA: hypothetical protein VF749_05340, partial [Candidatus Acidoferrum sp.]
FVRRLTLAIADFKSALLIPAFLASVRAWLNSLSNSSNLGGVMDLQDHGVVLTNDDELVTFRQAKVVANPSGMTTCPFDDSLVVPHAAMMRLQSYR